MIWVLYFLMFLLGAAVGSFLNVLIARSIKGESWVAGRSHCDHCGKVIPWYQMIPIFSYLLLRGRTSCCHKPLSIQHIVVESMVGVLFTWWLLVGSWFFRLMNHPLSTIQPTFWLLIGLILTGILVTDLFYGLIPSYFVGAGTALILVYRLTLALVGVYQWRDLGLAILSAAAAWLFFWFLRFVTKGRGMGDGDLILAFMIGLLLGWPKTAVWVWVSFILGAFISLILIMMRIKKMRSTVPFGPFMIAGVWIILVWGEKLLALIE